MLLRATLENILVGIRREMDGGGRELFVVVELVGQCPKLWDSELKAWTFWRFLFSIFDQPHLTSAMCGTMAMKPRSLRLQNSFRMPLPLEMGRDALFVALDLYSSIRRPNSAKEVLRVFTTHLESLEEGHSLRARQLELISKKIGGYRKWVQSYSWISWGAI